MKCTDFWECFKITISVTFSPEKIGVVNSIKKLNGSVANILENINEKKFAWYLLNFIHTKDLNWKIYTKRKVFFRDCGIGTILCFHIGTKQNFNIIR